MNRHDHDGLSGPEWRGSLLAKIAEWDHKVTLNGLGHLDEDTRWMTQRSWERHSIELCGEIEHSLSQLDDDDISSLIGDFNASLSAATEESLLERMRGLALVRLNARRTALQARQPRRVLAIWAIVLPHRVATEDVGGYVERLQQLIVAGAPMWQVWLQVASAILWTGCAALRELPGLARSKA